MRLISALDYLENYIVDASPQDAKQDSEWFIQQWQRKGLAERYSLIETAVLWFLNHHRYIPKRSEI